MVGRKIPKIAIAEELSSVHIISYIKYGEIRCSNACLVRCGAGWASDTQLRLAPEVGRGVVGLLSLTRPL